MKNIPSQNYQQIEKFVLAGLVMDRSGAWRPIDEVVAEQAAETMTAAPTSAVRPGKRDEPLPAPADARADTLLPRIQQEPPVAQKPDAAVSPGKTPAPAEKNRVQDKPAAPSDDTAAFPPLSDSVKSQEKPSKKSEPETKPVSIADLRDLKKQKIEQPDPDTKKILIAAREPEAPKTSLILREEMIPAEEQESSAQNVTPDGALLDIEEFEDVINQMEMADSPTRSFDAGVIADPAAALKEQDPGTVIDFTGTPEAESRDEWDQARSGNLKLIIAAAVMLVAAAGALVWFIFL
jgi:hypothetical protein